MVSVPVAAARWHTAYLRYAIAVDDDPFRQRAFVGLEEDEPLEEHRSQVLHHLEQVGVRSQACRRFKLTYLLGILLHISIRLQTQADRVLSELRVRARHNCSDGRRSFETGRGRVRHVDPDEHRPLRVHPRQRLRVERMVDAAKLAVDLQRDIREVLILGKQK